MGNFQAVLFDLDGVLVDSEPLYLAAINLLLSQCDSRAISDEENQQFLIGTTVNETWTRIKSLRDLQQPIEYYINKYDPIVRAVLEQRMQPQPGVTTLLQAIKKRRLKAAVASSSLRSWVNLKLINLQLIDYFDALVGGDEVDQGKPAPDIYNLAAQQIGLTPNQCIAIEDSPTGISAAVSSGAYTIAVKTSSTKDLNISKAHMILNSLEEFDFTLLGVSKSNHSDEKMQTDPKF